MGALQYVTLTHLEISFSVNKTCQFMHYPTYNWQMVKRILHYLNGVLSHVLLLQKSSHFNLYDFADAGWASNPNDRKSTFAFCVYLGGNLISWGSNK